MNSFVKILDFNVFSKSKKECLDLVFSKEKVHIISGNPEVLYLASKNQELSAFFKREDNLIIPDGVGTKIAAKMMGVSIQEKIAGIEVMDEVLKYCVSNNKEIYMIGASEDIINNLIINLKIKYPLIKIVGYRNGFFDDGEESILIEDIKKKNPYAIFVAMGCPKQELFIKKYMDSLSASIFMGVGGSFDVYAGKNKRAPKWMINCGCEWLYRVIREPFRIKRLVVIPKFLMKVLIK